MSRKKKSTQPSNKRKRVRKLRRSLQGSGEPLEPRELLADYLSPSVTGRRPNSIDLGAERITVVTIGPDNNNFINKSVPALAGRNHANARLASTQKNSLEYVGYDGSQTSINVDLLSGLAS